MRRRDFISLIGGSATWPIAARAQQAEGMRHVGFLSTTAESDPEGRNRVAAFQKGLQPLGWIEGRNIQIDFRSSPDPDRRRTYATQLVGSSPDVIVAASTSALASLQQATRKIPIVFAQVSDPVGMGFVTNLAHPGGNITGFALYDQVIGVKWLELVKQIVPRVVDVAVLYDPATPSSSGYLAVIQAGAPSSGVQVTQFAVHSAAEIAHAVDTFAAKQNGGLVVLPGPIVNGNRDLIIRLAAEHHLPAVYPYRYFVADGGLASYGVDYIDTYRRAASYVDRILKGEKPADLPVQEVDKFELVINLKTAKALGLTISESFLLIANEVIE